MPCGVQRCEDPCLQGAPHCGMCEATRWMSCMRAWGCRVHSQACLGVRGQQWEGQRGGGARCFWYAREGRNDKLLSSCCPPAVSHHTRCLLPFHTHALHTLHSHTSAHARWQGGECGVWWFGGWAHHTNASPVSTKNPRTQLSGGCVHLHTITQTPEIDRSFFPAPTGLGQAPGPGLRGS